MISLNPSSPPNIIFECSDLKNDIGLMITSTKNNNNDFQLHLYDGYNEIALVMNINIQDFNNMFESLEEYFSKSAEIDPHRYEY